VSFFDRDIVAGMSRLPLQATYSRSLLSRKCLITASHPDCSHALLTFTNFLNRSFRAACVTPVFMITPPFLIDEIEIDFRSLFYKIDIRVRSSFNERPR
jgi:hypothetical protein